MHSGIVTRSVPQALALAGLGVLCSGCTPLRSWISGKSENPESVPAKTTALPKPLVSNAFAYARFVALNLDSKSTNELPPAEVERILFESSLNSKISAETMLKLLAAPQRQQADGGKSTSQLRLEEFQGQLGACVEQFGGAKECCQGLAWPLAVLPQLTTLEPARLSFLTEAAKSQSEKSSTLKSWAENGADLPNQVGSGSGERSYRLAGLKAWLGACHVVLNGAPATLSEFAASLGSNFTDKAQWSQTLHAKSRAKRGPRRVFARLDGQLSVAQTLSTDCSVKETEIIRRRTDGSLDYWVYDAQGKLTPVSHFPAPNNNKGFTTVEKLSPDSCMGCHYSFDTRHFDQLKVSADALRLEATRDLPVLCREPGESLAEDN